VPIGLGYDRPWRSRRAWDQFAVPRPYSRARALVGPKVQIPADVNREGVERYRLRVEQMLNLFTVRAEEWAASGTRYLDQVPARKQGTTARPSWRTGQACWRRPDGPG